MVADIGKRMGGFEKIMVDSTGLGAPIVEHCKELGLKAEGVNLGAKTKEELMSNLRIALERKMVVLPQDLTLLGNLTAVVAERRRDGGYSFTHARGTHDDLAYALALSLWGARQRTISIIGLYDLKGVG
jgi:phage FluMu gp28-like protein